MPQKTAHKKENCS